MEPDCETAIQRAGKRIGVWKGRVLSACRRVSIQRHRSGRVEGTEGENRERDTKNITSPKGLCLNWKQDKSNMNI